MTVPGPHPLPPRDLARRSLPTRITNQSWFRFHDARHPALYWGRDPPRPSPSRFDAPSEEYGVLYAGADEHAAFIETFGWEVGTRRVDLVQLRARGLARIDVGRPLVLVDLTGAGLARLGADARLFAGDYDVAHRWALAFFRHPSAPDGIYYPGRHDPGRASAAIFDLAAGDVTAVSLGTLADPIHSALLRELLATYGFGLGRP